jgi:hypothetical protein
MSNDCFRLLPQLVSSGICAPAGLPGKYQNVFLTPNTTESLYWVIGPYPVLCELSKELRTNQELSESLLKNGIQFGFRKTDKPPTGLTRQKEYGKSEAQPVGDFSESRLIETHIPIKGKEVTSCRISDQYSNIMEYWKTQSPQAHHIVEFNNLEAARVSTRTGSGDLDYQLLPCVLMMAEFHQRYITSKLKDTHGWDDRPAELIKKLRARYDQIYFSDAPQLASLGKISAAKFSVAAKMI